MNLKDEYNKAFVDDLALKLSAKASFFDKKSFVKSIINDKWEQRELKDRVKCISHQMNEHIQLPYKKQIKILSEISLNYKGLPAFVFPNFVEQFGLNDFTTSIKAMEIFTQQSTAEFAIRPFIEKYPKETMQQMLEWSNHKNEHLRRLSSEGCRPRLPWATPLREFIKDPSPCLPILENLKNDDSEYVRKSVANHLNDISKNHPEIVLNFGNNWYGKSSNTNWIVKHALRTLLKKGDKQALAIFGLNDSSKIEVKNLSLSQQKIKIGDFLFFEFDVINQSIKERSIRLEYKVDYVKANGTSSSKVFQISEFSLKANSSKPFKRKQWFKQLSTRVHYPGIHKITLIINGEEKESVELDLKP